MFVIRSKDGKICTAFASKQNEEDYPEQEEMDDNDPELVEFMKKFSIFSTSGK